MSLKNILSFMISKIKKILAALLLFFPFSVLAQNDAVNQGLNSGGLTNLFGGGLAQEHSLAGLIVDIIYILLYFAGAVAVLFIIVGGFWYITSAGNEEQAEKGRKALVNAIIGIIVIVLSYTIIRVVQNTVTGGAVL